MTKITQLAINGCYSIQFDQHRDQRGLFQRIYCSDTFKINDLKCNWVQTNVSSTTLPGTIRGMHMLHEKCNEHKLVTCVNGSVYDVVVDLRENSETFGCWVGSKLEASDSLSIYISPGCAHGFQALAENSVLIYAHSTLYRPEAELGINYNDTEIGINWPLETSLVSQRDKHLPSFEEFMKKIWSDK
jgi:dTDP-4-dehydrorhamnose 3,5-epimerase